MDWKCHWKKIATSVTTVVSYRRPRYRGRRSLSVLQQQMHHSGLWCSVLIVLLLIIPSIMTSNNACDWTGSGLSTSIKDRDVVSIYLRCTAGKIIWNYPKGAIRVVLRSPIGLQKHFRACLKIHRTHHDQHEEQTKQHHKHHQHSQSQHNHQINVTNTNNHNHRNDLNSYHGSSGGGDGRSNSKSNSNKRVARIFLEGPKRLIALYDDDDPQIVKCFRSINEQVALYVEADETPFENLKTIFEYNLEFINNKHHSMRPIISDDSSSHSSTTASNSHHHNHNHKDLNTNHISIDIDEDDHYNDNDNSHLEEKTDTKSMWWWSWWTKQWNQYQKQNQHHTGEQQQQLGQRQQHRQPNHHDATEDIIGSLGESWEICRPCTDTEMVHAYCSSDIVTRGTIFNVQERPMLNTIEIAVKHTKILRNNLLAISDAQDVWRHYYKTQTTANSIPFDEPNGRHANGHHAKSMMDQNGLNGRQNDDVGVEMDHDGVVDDIIEFKFHTPSHCSASHGEGEFVFMGRRRFDEIMLICAPRLDEWVLITRQFNDSNMAPCILQS